MGQKWVFTPEAARGMTEVSLTKMGGGAIQGFETPIMTLGFFNKFLHPGKVRRGQKWVFTPEGAMGMP